MIETLNFDLYTNLELLFKLLLAIITGSIIGIERVKKRRPAGIKTHSLVCLGAALVMITGEYIFLIYDTGDIARLGAQVISGVGFLGAGTIMVTGGNKISGLTTAAGLWLSACIGLTIGIGYYSAVFIAIFMTIIVRYFLSRIDGYYKNHAYTGDFRVVLEDRSYFVKLLLAIKSMNGMIVNIGDTKDSDKIVTLTIAFDKTVNHLNFIDEMNDVKGVLMFEEL